MRATTMVDNKAGVASQRNAALEGLCEIEALRQRVWDSRATSKHWVRLVVQAAGRHSSN